jgi:hypothetical protein
MTKGIREGEPDARKVYADIIDLPHHRSSKHPPMSLYDRAAQFAPFAALSGYEDMVHEETRLVDRRIELTDEEIEINSRKLSRIAEVICSGQKPVLSITYFVPDLLKIGGTYETIRKPIRKVDPVHQSLELNQTTGFAGSWLTIPIRDILEIHEDPIEY